MAQGRELYLGHWGGSLSGWLVGAGSEAMAGLKDGTGPVSPDGLSRAESQGRGAVWVSASGRETLSLALLSHSLDAEATSSCRAHVYIKTLPWNPD